MKNDSIKISHIYNDGEWHIQTNEEHCEGVARLASQFASEFGMAEWGHIIGLLHDRGKESEGFQAHIRSSSGYDPTAKSKYSKDHSYIGAILAHCHYNDKDYWLSNAIASHHGELYNTDELEPKLTNAIPKEVSTNIPDIKLTQPKSEPDPRESSHISRMLYSCLVDADWLDTEKFMDSNKAAGRRNFSSLAELDQRLQTYLKKLKALPSSPVNDIRNEVQAKCEEAATLEPGFFELTVPTGGGKTLASVIWAIKHVLAFNKKRVIISIPFRNITAQTADELRKIFGEDNVVEHHSALNESTTSERSLLACENWDAPIIVTTNVQLFESMFSNKRAVCRKLHSLANSVVILDEVQAIPLYCLQPIVDAMSSYVKLFGTSFLFCTATQPILDGERKGCGKHPFKGIDRTKINSIISEDMRLHDRLRRVRINIEEKPQSYESLSKILKKHKRVLCIVSSRKHALELYNELSKDAGTNTIHLSRSMCSAHILEKITEIKLALADPEKEIRVVSTQLIEAGVDIDFPVVFRQLAGLDSIIQAAGRCNREGKEKEGQTNIFTFNRDDQLPIDLRLPTYVMRNLISQNPDTDWYSPDKMRLYYEKLYSQVHTFDKSDIIGLIDNNDYCQLKEISKEFHMIDKSGPTIIINFRNSYELIMDLKKNGPSRELSRNLGRFSITIPQKVFNRFKRIGLIEEPYSGFFFIQQENQYDDNIGLKNLN